MRRKSLRILMLAFMSLWFGVVVPGHQRGIIQMPGSCCAAKPSCCDQDKNPRKTPGPANSCAICYTFLCTLQLPAPIVLNLPPVTVIDELSPPMLQSLAGVAHLIDPRGRGPPTVA